eukprot:10727912-Alexandrium_andersonii.AAC.1
MSASLVGSEMCIRDSLRGLCVDRLLAVLRVGLFVARARLLGKLVRVEPPVSYTHLTLPTICSV